MACPSNSGLEKDAKFRYGEEKAHLKEFSRKKEQHL